MNNPKAKILNYLVLLVVVISVSASKLMAQIYINGNVTFVDNSTLFSNVVFGPDANVRFENGAEVVFLGSNMTVDIGSEFNAPINPTGKLIFSSTSGQQTLVGGNSSAIGGAQPSLINVEINNSNGVVLNTSNTRLTGGLILTNGNLFLGSQSLELESTATITGASSTSYVITDGSGYLAKENFSTSFTFPVGRAASDYTPTTITPSSTDNFFVQVKNYSESSPDEVTTSDGIDRTWNIFSTNGNGAVLSLQHNSSTNGSNYTANGGDASAFVSQYEGVQWVPYVGNQGTWQLGSGAQGTNNAGSVVGSVIHSRTYASTATSASVDEAFFSKSTLALTPLPLVLIDFTVNKKDESTALLNWSTSTEINSSHFEIETSLNGQHWNPIGEINAKGNSYERNNYHFLHLEPFIGLNYYRFKMVDRDGSFKYSPIRSLDFTSTQNQDIIIYPNPVSDLLFIKSPNPFYSYTLSTMDGKVISEFNNASEDFIFTLDLTSYANGVYFINVNSKSGQVQTLRIIRNN